jgi:hypothetical protein
MSLLNQFGPFSNSWPVNVNSDVKHTMHSMGVYDVVMHDVGMHNMGVHDVAMHDMAVHDVGVPGMTMTSMGFYKTLTFFSGKKLIFDDHLGKKTPIFPYYMSLNTFLNIED